MPSPSSTSSAHPHPHHHKPAKPGSIEEELQHVQFKSRSFQSQLAGYMDEYETQIKKREGQQGLRNRFLEVLQELVRTHESMSASKVWLYMERERVLEQMARLQELKTRQVQNQRRIKELLLRTDPNSTRKEVKAGAVQLAREAHLEIIYQTLETLEAQRIGYRELAHDYLQGLEEDARIRAEDIRWGNEFCSKALKGFDGLVEKSEELRLKVLERYLVRRHNTKLLKDGMEATQAMCGPVREALEGDIEQLRARQIMESDALKRASEKEFTTRVEALRTQVRARENDYKDLTDWYSRIQESYLTRVKELKREIRLRGKKYKELQKTRKEAHTFFNRALKDVRDRLALYEVGCSAQAVGLEKLIESLYRIAEEGGRGIIGTEEEEDVYEGEGEGGEGEEEEREEYQDAEEYA